MPVPDDGKANSTRTGDFQEARQAAQQSEDAGAQHGLAGPGVGQQAAVGRGW